MMRSRGMGPSTATLRLADTTTLQTPRQGQDAPRRRGLGKALASHALARHVHAPWSGPFGDLYAGMALQSNSAVAEHVGLEPLIAEGAARVKPLLQAHEVAMPLVAGGDRRRVRMKELAPVRADMERRQRLLDLGCDALDRVLLSLPGEVERHAILPVVHAHPQLVGSDGADLGDEQERLDAAREPPHGCEGLNGVPAWKEVLRLYLFAAARRESHPEVWDAVRPGTGPAQLRGAGGGVHHAG